MSKRTQWLIGAGLFAGLAIGPEMVQWVHLRLMQRRLDHRLAQLAAQRERLIEEQQRLQSDPAYVEGLIRSTFKVSQPGELVIPLDSRQSNGKTR